MLDNSTLFGVLAAKLLTLAMLAWTAAAANPSGSFSHESPLSFEASGIRIAVHSGTPYELQGVEQLRRLLRQYDLSRWIRDPAVLVQQGSGPSSRNGIRLNTRYLDDDDWQLSVLVHEQGHLYFNGRRETRLEAIERLGGMYPDAPVSRDAGGGRTRHDTLLHLMVCMLEYDALVSLIGPERTRALFDRKDYYQWIYAKVLADEAIIRGVMAAHGLNTY